MRQRSDRSFSADDVDVIARDTCFAGFFKLERFRFRHRRFEGGWSGEVAREVFLRGNATCVMPFDRRMRSVALVEQVRAGALLDDASPWLLEPIAGINEEGEAPADVARREAQEEAGLTLGALRKITEYYPSPGACTEKITLFLAQADLSEAGGIHGLAEEQEDIRVHILPFEQALAMVDAGQINNSPAVIALNFMARFADDLDALFHDNDAGNVEGGRE